MNTLDARRRLLGRNVYKKTTEGNPAIAQGSLARRYPRITMQGWTEQAQYEWKNLFDKTKIEDRIDTTHTQTDTGIEVSGLYYVTYRVSVAPNTDMRISYNKSGEGTNLVSVYGTDLSPDNLISSSYGTGMEFNTGKHTEILVLFYCSGGTEDVSIYNDVMLNLGSTSLPYEPYTGGAPSPSPEYPQEIVSAGKYNEDTGKYEVEVKLTVKNIIDKEDLYVYENLIKNFQGKGFWIYPIDIPDGTYTFSAENSPYNSGGYLAIGTYTQDSVSAKGYIAHPSVATKTVTFELSGNKCIILSASNQINDNVKNAIGWIQLEHGSVATEYEQYKEPQTVTVTSDRPLTKWDKLEKRNGQWGWVYKSAEIVLDGSGDEVWELCKESTTQLISFQIDLQGHMKGSQVSLCDKYINKYGAWYMDKYGIYSDHKITEYKYFRPPSAEVETVEQWTDWLAQNPLTVWYETAEETFVPLSAEEQEQMNALYTFRPTTVLSNDCNCNMSLTYKTKKSMGGG